MLFGINLSPLDETLVLEKPLTQSRIEHFLLSPSGGNLTARTVLLNGKPLKISAGDDLVPEINPNVTGQSSQLNLPSYSMGFWDFSDTNVALC